MGVNSEGGFSGVDIAWKSFADSDAPSSAHCRSQWGLSVYLDRLVIRR